LPPLLFSLAPVEDELARHSGEAEVLVFDLVDVAKALAHLPPSWCMLVFDLAASPKATEQFEQTIEVGEAFLERCLHLHLDWFVVAFGHAGAAALLLNMVDARLHQMVSSVAGDVTSLHTIPSRNL
jgi:hypothetical protein